MRMVNTRVERVMINIGNSVNILYFDAFQKLIFSTNNLTLMAFSLIGFTSDSISPFGTISLYVIFKDEPSFKIVMTKFIVVDISSAYNVIICWPTLNMLWVVVSTCHILMRFLTNTSVEELRSNSKESYRYYLTIISLPRRSDLRYHQQTLEILPNSFRTQNQ